MDHQAPFQAVRLRMGLDITNRLVDLTHVKALIQVQLEFTHLELTVVPELF